MKPEHGMDTVSRPTAEEWAAGPVYTLRRADLRCHDWNLHGFNYPIQFRGGAAEIYGPHYEQWFGDTLAASHRLRVIKPEPEPEPEPEPAPKKRRRRRKGTK